MVNVVWYKDPTGRFPERPHFDLRELDNECERIIEEFLASRRSREDARRYPITTNELTILLEQYTSDLDLYADLSDFGSDVQGQTVFAPKAKPIVRISNDLHEQYRENRLRTTLTHELGHVVFHNFLYGMYPGAANRCCDESSLIAAPAYDWMEWQAGYCSGSFLLPARSLKTFVRAARGEMGIRPSERIRVGTPESDELISRAKARYQVSADASRVRLCQLQHIAEF